MSLTRFVREFHLALRIPARQPVFAATVTLVIALGVGANAAVFSFVHSVLWARLPFAASDNLVILTESSRDLNTGLVSPNAYLEWRDRNTEFSEIAAFMWWEGGPVPAGSGNTRRQLTVSVSRDYFDVLGVKPLLGRTFTDADIKAGFSSAMILSYELWQRDFNGDPTVVGRMVTSGTWKTEIVGVMPPGPINRQIGWGDAWRPLRMRQELDRTLSTDARYIRAIARLRDGVSLGTASGQLTTIQRQLQRERPAIFGGYDVRLTPLRDVLAGEFRPASFVLAGIVGCLLLLASASLGNMLVARHVARERELTVRMALGASSADLISHLVAENGVLAALGCAGGLVVYQLTLVVFGRWEPGIAGSITSPVWLVGACCAVLSWSMALAATLPVITGMRRVNVSGALKESGRSSTAGARSQRTRQLLVIGQVILAVSLLVVSGLLMRSFVKLLTVDGGFKPEQVLLAEMALPEGRYGTGDQRRAFYRHAMDALEALPGIGPVGGLRYFPMHARLWTTTVDAERAPLPVGQRPIFYFNCVAGRYFEAMGIPLIAGRWPSAEEMWERGGVLVMNARAAKRLFPEGNAVGQRVRVGDAPPREVVGVVGDTRQAGLSEEPRPEVYELMANDAAATGILTIAIQTHGAPERYTEAVTAAIERLDPALGQPYVTPMLSFMGNSVAARRTAARMGSVFAGLALILSALGIYGLISQWVTERTAELGIRVALGASRGQVIALVVRQGLWLTVVGAAIGVIGSVGLAHALSAFLFGISTLDPLTFALAPIVLIGASVLATLVPALRAVRLDPVHALRAEQ